MGDFQWLIDLLPTVGFCGVVTLGACVLLYKIIFRVLDENKNREETTAKTLNEISNTIKESSMTSKELSETNRLMVERMTFDLQSINSSVNQMNGDLKTILDKLDKEE